MYQQSGYSSVCSSASTLASSTKSSDESISYTSSEDVNISRKSSLNLLPKSFAEDPRSNLISLWRTSPPAYDKKIRRVDIHRIDRSAAMNSVCDYTEERHKRQRLAPGPHPCLQGQDYQDTYATPQCDLSTGTDSSRITSSRTDLLSVSSTDSLSALAAAAQYIWASTRPADSALHLPTASQSSVANHAAAVRSAAFPEPSHFAYARQQLPLPLARHEPPEPGIRAGGSCKLRLRKRAAQEIEEYSLGSGYPG